MSIYAIGVFATLLLYVVVGNYAGLKVKNVDDYFVSGRNAPTILIVGTLVASFLSSNCMMGEVGFCYDGYPGPLLWMVSFNVLGYLIGALFFGRYIRRSECVTVPEYFGRRFNSRKVQIAAGVTTIVAITAYLLAVTQGCSLLMEDLLNINKGPALIIVWFVYTSFTFYGGSKGVIITDTLMFFLIVGVMFIVPTFIVGQAGGWTEVLTQLANYEGTKAGILSWHGAVGPEGVWLTPAQSLLWAITFGVAWMGTVAVSPWQTSRYLMARNEHVVMRSAIICGPIIAAMYVMIAIVGSSMNLINPNLPNGELTLIWAAFNILPTWIGIMVLGGILAAGLSSASTFLSLVGFSVTKDIIGDDKFTNDKQKLLFSRIIMAGCGLIALILCYYRPPALFWMSYFAGTVLAASWGPPALMSIWSKKITADAAFWGITLGFVANCVAKMGSVYNLWSLPVWADPFLIGLICSLLSVLIVSSFTKVTDAEREYQQRLFIKPMDKKYLDKTEIKRTLLYPKLAICFCAVFILLMIFMYVIPYSKVVSG